MLFNSVDFFIFYIIVSFLYFVSPHRFRWLLLLIASCYFYMYFVPIYIVILAVTIVIDYFAGIYLTKLQGNKRKWLLFLSIFANLGILITFKYYNFFVGNLNHLFAAGSFNYQFSFLSILLPIGLSFHTFQAMSYTIEVYRGNQQPEKHFGIYALYVMFYPQLVAGPIERPQHMLHQFHEKKYFNQQNLSEGLKLMLWGYFKKVVVADRLAVYVGTTFENYINQTGSTLMLSVFFFTIQIYCDFSGYSDIAIGSAKTMGFDLMTNFRQPYLAVNINDFWRRWHISLSTWFRDYVYIPLGGNKGSALKRFRNRMAVFLLSGLWHGANWTFIIWGLLHGLFSGAQKTFSPATKGRQSFIRNLPSILFTFFIVSFTWIFFRSTSIKQALGMIKKIGNGITDPVFIKTPTWMFISLLSIGVVMTNDFLAEYSLSIRLLHNKLFVVRCAATVLLVIIILLFGIFNTSSFIYFQF